MPDTIALVGSESLMGRDVRDLLEVNSLGAELRLVAGEEEASGVLSEHAGEAAVVNPLNQVALLDADVIILAGSKNSSDQALAMAGTIPVIDLTHAVEDNPRSRLRAPLVEPPDFQVPLDAIQSIAHPAAIALALLLRQLEKAGTLRSWIVHIFEPASERGAVGIDELQAQAVSLFSFKPMPKKVFDTQLSFNLLARLGEDAAVVLDQVESRIERHLATLLQNTGQSPMPSIRLLQAPVFHGYTFSIWAEWDREAPLLTELEDLLEGEHVDVHTSDVDPPDNVSIAGQDGVSVGAISRDRNNPRAVWLWAAADNLRLAAQNAILVAREML